MGAFGPLNFLRSYVYGVDFDAEHEQAMLNQQENTRRVERERMAEHLAAQPHEAARQGYEQAREYSAAEVAFLQTCPYETRIATAAETTYVVEETRQLPVHEQEQQS